MATKAPPPIPSRDRRATLSEAEVPAAIQDLKIEEQPTEVAAEEQEFIPIEVQNGEPLVDQQVAPGRYLWYSAIVEGTAEDLVQFDISRTLHGGATNVYVNVPLEPLDHNTAMPSKDHHSWNPKMGVLYGPVGTYVIGVEGVPSFIEKDDKWLVDPNSNWATFDLQVSWTVLDESSRKTIEKMKDQYTIEKSSNVWSSNYTAEVQAKYQQQQEEYEKELQERQQQSEQANAIQTLFNVDNTPIAVDYDVTSDSNSLLYRSDFCIVRKATTKKQNAGQKVAIKIINKEKAKETGLDALVFQQQLDILKNISSHTNIVPFVSNYDTDKLLAIVTELQEGGELIPGILGRFGNGTGVYSEDVVRKIVGQLLEALKYLHEQGIVHKSILPENVLFHSNNNGDTAVKIVGFGLSHRTTADNNNNAAAQGISGGGDPAFQAPELIQQQQYSTQVDMWATGVLTYILLCGSSPFQDSNTIRLYSKIRQGNFQFDEALWSKVSPQGQEFVSSLIAVDANKRLTAPQALQHQWFKASDSGSLAHVVPNLKTFYSQQ